MIQTLDLKVRVNAKNTCDLMSWTGILIQALLCLFCLIAQIIKRLTENPRRSWLIWFLDIFKQVAGITIMHFFNIILALIIAKPSSKLDQCAWYWIQYNIDVFFGTVLNWAVMKFLDWMFNKCKCTRMVTGNYFDKKSNRISFCIWFAQTLVWSLVVQANKFLLYSLQIPIIKFMKLLSTVALSWLWPEIKMFFVQIIWPGVGNTIQMWIQDTILKKKKFTRSDIVVRSSYFTAEAENAFILAPPLQSKRKSFISDINESARNIGRDDSFMDLSRNSSRMDSEANLDMIQPKVYGNELT